MRLKDKVALITGAGSGIGRATAVLFAKEGARVVVADIDANGGERTVQEIKHQGGEAVFVKADVRKVSDVKNMIEKAAQQYGRLDILHNNAGIGEPGTVVDTTEETWDRTIDIMLKGTFLGMKYAIPIMIKQGGGTIINTASVNAFCGLPNEVAYDAAKGGVLMLTKSTALDFGSKNIRVNCVCPGVVNTPLFQKYSKTYPDPKKLIDDASKLQAAYNRMITPEEVAYVALFLASDESSGVTGSAYLVDGGYLAI